jgi:hypothetical protein
MSERVLQVVLVVAGIYHVAQGALGLIDPGTFFDQIGRYGLENDHYIGDVGAFYLAAGIGLLIAAARPSWRVPILVVGAIWYGLHALNHAFDVDEARSDARGITDTVLLALAGAGSAYLARVSAKLEADRAPSLASEP